MTAFALTSIARREIIAASTLVCLAMFPANGARATTCDDRPLTFRWNSASPLRFGIAHPPAEALRNLPFLVNPTILSVKLGRDRIGFSMISIAFGQADAAILDRELAGHQHEQMLVMRGDTIVAAAEVASRVEGNAIYIHNPDRQRSEQIAHGLRPADGSQDCGSVPVA